MNTLVLKSNSTSKSKLNSKYTKLYNSLFTNISIIAHYCTQKEKGGERERENHKL